MGIFRTGLLTGLLALTALPALSQQQEVIPERRIEVSENTDFPGNDLRNIFDVTFRDCVTACLTDSRCTAFTYNEKSSACFPKASARERLPFARATSAEIKTTPAPVLARARQRAAQLSFLPQGLRDGALTVARRNGQWYPTNGWTHDALIEEARRERNAGRHFRAMELVLAALNDDDRADGWIEVANLANIAKPANSKQRRFIREMGAAAAINGFYRALSPAQQGTALMELAGALEKQSNGRLSVPVLRLASDISARRDIEAALDRAIGLYGFRITDHRVDHNAASPRVCAQFSETLVENAVDYSDFIRAETTGLSAEAEDRQLCVDGLRHGERYRIAFRAGLPAANGETLQKTVELNVYVQDRDASARFSGRAYVLPQRPDATVPVITVNTARLDVKIFRVGDRNVLRAMDDNLFAKPISRWDMQGFTETLGQEIWSGTAEISGELNREVTTALPVGDAILEAQPGVYALTARAPDTPDADTIATQWFIITDIGIATLEGNGGLHVFARSLKTAEAMEGATVRLVSKSNIVLGEAVTDAEGRATFGAELASGTGSAAPALVTVEMGTDYAFLDQDAAEFDLSDRGVEGRPPAPPIDVFLTTDRGAYRPGETIHTTLLARDHTSAALTGVPLTLDLIRPDGVRYRRLLATGTGAGGYVTSLDLPANAARGSWKLRVLADREAPPLLEEPVLVEDFVPEKIDFDLSLAQDVVRLDSSPTLSVDARYLFGAPGAGLAIEGTVRLKAVSELAGFPGFAFGSHEAEFHTVTAGIGGGETGPDGRARIALDLPQVDTPDKPLEMETVLRLRDGSGRPVERRISAPVAPAAPLIGIKPLFDGAVSEGAEARFAVLAVGRDGRQMDLGTAEWVINRLNIRYQWYNQYGSWSYEPIVRRERVASGSLTLTAEGAATISAPVEWGRYEVKVIHRDAPFTQSSTRFSAGWYASGAADDTPDLLDVGLDRPAYAVGDTVSLRLVSRFDGVARISVLSDRLIATEAVPVTRGDNTIAVQVTEDWGAGAYVTASVVQPMGQAADRSPARALGLAYAPVDPGRKALSVAFESRPEATPRESYEAVLKVAGVQPGETAHATIAAVDVGVLNLTRFAAPDPSGHYFGQRRLGVELRDLYGRLIAADGVPGRLRSGGDGGAGAGMQSPPPNEEVLALFSGPLTVGPDGTVRHRFDLPDFNGTVKLMAVVWSDTGIGEAEQDVLVRDPVVLSAFAPRFLTPGDRSRIRLEMTHAFGPTGAFELTLGTSAGLAMEGGTRTVRLTEDGQKLTLDLPVEATAPGAPRFEAFLKTPDGRVLSKSITLAVQWNDPEIARQTRVSLAPGETLTLDDAALSGLRTGTASATLALGPLARFDAPGLLSALDRYPYGCTEQVTSRAMPLLYFEQLSSALGLADKAQVRERVDQAVRQVLSNQSSNGAFGLWRPDSGDLWLDAFVTDFLSRARAQGFEVPELAFAQALDNLRNRVNYAGDFEEGGEDVAYALLVLAREGHAAMGDLRYYADARADNFATPLAQAQVGAALAAYGDQARADRMFRLAGARAMAATPSNSFRADYGTVLRDSAAVLSLAVAAGSTAVDRVALADRVASAPAARRSTQENLWSLMAVRALLEEGGADGLTLNGTPMAPPLVRALNEADLAAPIRIANTGNSPVTTVLTTYGVPVEPEPADGNGYRIQRSYFTLEGRPVELSQVAPNSRLVAVLKITPLRDRRARLIVNDPLPAGLEIDNPALIEAGSVSALGWLKPNAYAETTEFRSDRFVAAVNWSGRDAFQLAYVVRAVSPGSFHHPAATVEDMYRPDFRARTGVGRVTVR